MPRGGRIPQAVSVWSVRGLVTTSVIHETVIARRVGGGGGDSSGGILS
jgi:hypothetical protein